MADLLTIAILVGLLYSLVTVGLAVAFRILNYPDLTLEGSLVFGATACWIAVQTTHNVLLSLLFGLIAGGLAGAATGVLHVYFNVSKLLSGIIIAAVLYSLNIRFLALFSEGSSLSGMSNVHYSKGPTLFTADAFSSPRELQSILILALIVGCFLVALAFFFRTRVGLLLRGLGENDRFLTAQGANPKVYLIVGLVSANAMIALSGGLVFHFNRVVDVNMTAGMLIAALAAMMIGETMVPSRRIWHHLCACVVGTIIYHAFVTLVLFFLGRVMTDVVIATDIRLLTGLCLIVTCVVVKRRRYKLFASTW